MKIMMNEQARIFIEIKVTILVYYVTKRNIEVKGSRSVWELLFANVFGACYINNYSESNGISFHKEILEN